MWNTFALWACSFFRVKFESDLFHFWSVSKQSAFHKFSFGPATHHVVHGEPLTLRLTDSLHSALAIGGLPAVPAAIELRHVTGQAFCGAGLSARVLEALRAAGCG